MAENAVQLNLPDEILCEIGKIVVLSSATEGVLAELIGLVVTGRGQILPEEVGDILTAEIEFKRRISIFESLLRHFTTSMTTSDDPKLRELPADAILGHWIQIRKRVEAAYDARNTIVHSHWFKANDPYPLANSLSVKLTYAAFPDGEATMSFLGGAADLSIERIDANLVVRAKTKSKTGRGLVQESVATSAEDVRRVACMVADALFLLGIFECYFRRDIALADTQTAIESWLSA